jgi:CBS domain containing-hemolysin-like protein
MTTLLVVLTLFVFCLLLIVVAMRPERSELSVFELGIRAKKGDKIAKKALDRELLLVDVITLQRIVVSFLLVITVLFCVAALGWLGGVLVGILMVLNYGTISQVSFVQNISRRLYSYIEKYILDLVCKYPRVFKFLRTLPASDENHTRHIGSRLELQHLVEESIGILSIDEKKLIAHGLSFGNKLVSSIMIPRSMISSIGKKEFLGPLTLNELHKIGHSRLPVTDGDIDHVVGILHLKSLLALDNKRSTTTEKVMDPKVFYIRQDQTLQHALAAFLRTRHMLFIVVNEFRETVGLITLEDVIEALLGRKIIDEFDAHDDLRAVALRNPHDNNRPVEREDV